MSKEVIYSANAPEPIGPYSQAIKIGSMLFVSGQIAIDKASGKILTDNITAETNQVLKNISEILTVAGMDFSHIVKCSIFLKDMGQFPVVNEAYAKKIYSQSSSPRNSRSKSFTKRCKRGNFMYCGKVIL